MSPTWVETNTNDIQKHIIREYTSWKGYDAEDDYKLEQLTYWRNRAIWAIKLWKIGINQSGFINKIGVIQMKIEIVSGEGEQGRLVKYEGRQSLNSIRNALKVERCDGDRWAFCVIEGEKVSDQEIQRSLAYHSDIPAYGAEANEERITRRN